VYPISNVNSKLSLKGNKNVREGSEINSVYSNHASHSQLSHYDRCKLSLKGNKNVREGSEINSVYSNHASHSQLSHYDR